MKHDPSHLLKLRLAVARFGEMDGAGWWNTKGILGGTGKLALSRGLPRTHLFAQARIACSVATTRCNSIFAPPGCLTLWNLPAEIEDQMAAAWPGWCRDPDPWMPFFEDIARRNSGDLLQHLRELDLIDKDTEAVVVSLKRSSEGTLRKLGLAPRSSKPFSPRRPRPCPGPTKTTKSSPCSLAA